MNALTVFPAGHFRHPRATRGRRDALAQVCDRNEIEEGADGPRVKDPITQRFISQDKPIVKLHGVCYDAETASSFMRRTKRDKYQNPVDLKTRNEIHDAAGQPREEPGDEDVWDDKLFMTPSWGERAAVYDCLQQYYLNKT